VNALEGLAPRPRQATSRRITSGTALRAYATGRRCLADDCHAKLSRYNPGETCSRHSGWADTRERTTRRLNR
jgi:hypothetical protein